MQWIMLSLKGRHVGVMAMVEKEHGSASITISRGAYKRAIMRLCGHKDNSFTLPVNAEFNGKALPYAIV